MKKMKMMVTMWWFVMIVSMRIWSWSNYEDNKDCLVDVDDNENDYYGDDHVHLLLIIS